MTIQQSYPKTRRISFDFREELPTKQYFAAGDIAMSHAVAGLSAAFPPGEDFFVRSVRRCSSKIADPDLKRRVAGFIGQEITHGRHHRDLNEQLYEMGYPTPFVAYPFGMSERIENLLDTRFPDPDQLIGLRRLCLAVTAGFEHFTAVFAEFLLTRPELQAMMIDPEVKNLLNWHAFEELEHKSVAFDVYRAMGGSERLRITVMRVLAPALVPLIVAGTWLSVAITDKTGRRQPLRIARETVKLVRGPMLRGIYRGLKPYMRKGFHPDHIDTTALLEQWQERLFGADGELVDHLKGGTSS